MPDVETKEDNTAEATNMQGAGTSTEATKVESPEDDSYKRYSKYFDEDKETDKLEAINSRMGSIESKLQELTPAQKQQVVDNMTPSDKSDFFELIRSGKEKEAEQILINNLYDRVYKSLSEQVVSKVAQQVSGEQQAIMLVNQHVEGLKSKNPDLAPLADLVKAKAETMIQDAQNKGKIKTLDDYVQASRDAYDRAVGDVRSLYNTIRGVGKTEALTSKQEIVSSQPVGSNPVKPHAEEDQNTAKRQSGESSQDYIARRQNRTLQLRGILPVERPQGSTI